LIPTLSSGQGVISTDGINKRLEKDIEGAREKYNFYDDFIKLSTVPYRQFKKGYPELRIDFQTTALKLNNETVNANNQLVETYQELAYLIANAPKSLKISSHSTVYDIECSYLGHVVKLRIYDEMGARNEKSKIWVNRAKALHLNLFRSIVIQAAPNKFKNLHSLRSLGRAEDARPF